MTHPLLPIVDRALALLTQASMLLIDASRWAESDSGGFSPLSLFAGPMKYWKWHQAKKRIAEAASELDVLRSKRGDVPDPSHAHIEISNLDTINDLFDVFPFSVRRVGTAGGPSPIKQQFGVEMTVYHQIETARVSVDHVMSEVGLLHARMRAAT